MKKIASLLLALLLLISAITPVMANNNITVKIDGRQIAFDVQPQLINGRTMVPLRAIFEALGAKVTWDDENQAIIAQKTSKKIVLAINNHYMAVNGTILRLDSPPCLVNGRTLVPVRAISEAFGATVTWDSKTSTVIISTSKTVEVTQECPKCYGSGQYNCSMCNGKGSESTFDGFYESEFTGQSYMKYKKEDCRWCNGRGRENCTTCNGTGKVKTTVTGY